MLSDTGAIIKTLTFDGATPNIAMAKQLGADIPNNPTFNHPITNEPIHIFLDTAHMLKLVRNTLGDLKYMYDQNNDKFEWSYFYKLVERQENEGLHLATKIRRRHINFFKEKMKVRLAAQTLSASVADALTYCQINKIPEFNNCNPTIEYCKRINDIIDFLNTQNFLGKLRYKKPLYISDESKIIEFVKSSIEYLKSLKDQDFKSITNSKRKTGFNGLITCLNSVYNLFNDTVKTGTMDFILTYKVSQDHLEMLFSVIRSRGGFNNNPFAPQFEATYKKLLIHTDISISNNANCTPQDSTNILHVSSNKKKPTQNFLDMLCVEEEPNIIIDDNETGQNLPNYNIHTVEYISGFVTKKAIKFLKCEVCIHALKTTTDTKYLLIDLKNRGGLTKPVEYVVKLCKISEKTFKTSIQCAVTSRKNPVDFLILKCMSQITNIYEYFPSLNNHIYSQSPINNHLLQLIKYIIKTYITIRLHHYNKELSQPKIRVRSELTKLITFKHQ